MGGVSDAKSCHFVMFLRIFLTSFAVSWTLDCVTSFFASDMLQIDENACITVKEFGAISSNSGRRLGESEKINGIFVNF